MDRKHTQVSEELTHLVSVFLARESNKESLITVTRSELSDDFKTILIYLSVLPAAFEKKALAFAKRERSQVREYLKSHSAIGRIPTVDFEIDYGEKNRQRIDELTRN